MKKIFFLTIISWNFALFGAFNFRVIDDQKTTCIANSTSQTITVTIETTYLGKKITLGSVELQPQEKTTLPETTSILFFKINNVGPEAIFPKTGIIVNESDA